MTTYRHAPVVEAVVDFTFESEFSARDLERIRDRFKRLYPAVGDRVNFNVEFRGTSPVAKAEVVGYQMTAANGTDVILVHGNNFTTSRLAPYTTWEIFTGTVKRNFELLVEIVDRPRVVRIATRFINRLDIPDKMVIGEDLELFFAGGIKLPDTVARTSSQFSLSINLVEKVTGLPTKLSLSTTPPVILEHQAFILDIDVQWVEDIPLRFEEMWTKMDLLRHAKNNIFESMLTEAAKELIS